MSAVDDILREIPLNQLAAQLGTDEATAQQAVSQAVPMLLQGMQSNVANGHGEQALLGALDQHAASPLFGGGENSVDLDQVDTQDGSKIVNHVFGGQDINALAGQYGAAGGAQGGLMQKLLPLLAPIVMAYLAQKLLGGRGGDGGLLGGMRNGQGQGHGQGGNVSGGLGGMGGGLGGILGGLLGGAMGGMGGLGGLLGGGQQQVADQHTYGEDRFNQQESYLPGGAQVSQPDGPFTTDSLTSDGVSMAEPDSNDSGTNHGQGEPADEGRQHEQHQQGGLGGLLGGLFGGRDERH